MCALDISNFDDRAAPPDPVYLEALQSRFNSIGLEHPLPAMLFRREAEFLPREGSNPPPLKAWKRANPNQAFILLDPITLVQMEVKLPPLPIVLVELQAATNNRDVTVDQIGELIAKDPALTAWILKIVNSPFFGFTSKIDTVTRAVMLLGIQHIQTLAIGGMLNTLMVRMPEDILDINAFWRHSVAVGIIAREIWKGMRKPEPERLFVAGLLHDCGILAMAYVAPKTFSAVESRASALNMPLYMVEKDLLNFDHPRLGGMLLHRWNMPLPLIMAILHHHEPENPQRHLEAAVVHVADIIAFALEGVKTPVAIPPLDFQAYDALGLGNGQMEEIFATAETWLDALFGSAPKPAAKS